MAQINQIWHFVSCQKHLKILSGWPKKFIVTACGGANIWAKWSISIGSNIFLLEDKCLSALLTKVLSFHWRVVPKMWKIIVYPWNSPGIFQCKFVTLEICTVIAEASFELEFQNPHFANLNAVKQQELLDKRQSDKTRMATKSYVKLLEEYLEYKSMKQLEEITDTELPQVLFSFYTNVCKEDGEIYKLASIKCIRASLNRYFKEKRSIDVIQDPRFIQANEMFRAVIVETKCQGKAVTISKRVIKKADMEIIANHFNHNHQAEPDPKLLQRNVIFNILYFFVRRGRENLHMMKKNWFKISLDPENDTRFLEQVQDKLDKNHGPKDTNLMKAACMS